MRKYGAVDYVTVSMKPVQHLTAKEAATHYNVSLSTIYRRARAGRIIASKNARGHWEILDNGTTLAVAEMAAEIANRLTVTAQPMTSTPTYDPNEYATDMFARRRAALVNAA